jgi:NADH dehydrogenase (ubiquinone) Fe-S protein 1
MESPRLLAKLNDKSYFFQPGLTVLQGCESSGILIPRFCYHERLSIAGNCRMCLVQLDKAAKPIASCALELSSGMVVYTNTLLVKKAREGVMEFLLANHPLDCPICDQGGECDLQDQALIFGNDRGRFYETKRSVSDKDWGSSIKTVMTRCIHCTRCQRFSYELSGRPEINMLGRGSKSEITALLTDAVLSEVSSNVIDLCPVGALTSKPYAFTARPWELTRKTSLDITDSLHSALSHHVAFNKVLRTLPILHQQLNEEWLSDRARFVYEGFRLQRLIVSGVSSTKSVLTPLSLRHSLSTLFFLIGPFFSFSLFFGDLSFTQAELLKKVSSYTYSSSPVGEIDQRQNIFLTPSYTNICESDLIVFAGVNFRRELPLFLVRVRSEQRKRPVTCLFFGFTDCSVSGIYAGSSIEDFLNFAEGRHVYSSLLCKAVKPIILLSSSFGFSVDGLSSHLRLLLTTVNSNLLVSTVASASLSANPVYELNSVTWTPKAPLVSTDAVLLLGLHPSYVHNQVSKSKSLIYIGSYGFDCLVRPTAFFLPISLMNESDGYYMNVEGRLQLARSVCSSIQKLSLDFLLYTLVSSMSKLLLPCQSFFYSDYVKNSLPLVSFFVGKQLPVRLDCSFFYFPIFSVYTTNSSSYASPTLRCRAYEERKSSCSSFFVQ